MSAAFEPDDGSSGVQWVVEGTSVTMVQRHRDRVCVGAASIVVERASVEKTMGVAAAASILTVEVEVGTAYVGNSVRFRERE